MIKGRTVVNSIATKLSRGRIWFTEVSRNFATDLTRRKKIGISFT